MKAYHVQLFFVKKDAMIVPEESAGRMDLPDRKLLAYIDGRSPEDDFTRELDEAVCSARRSEKWRVDYMTLQMHYQEKYEEGMKYGMERGNIQSAKRMIEDGELSLEKIALYSDLTTEQVLELEQELRSE